MLTKNKRRIAIKHRTSRLLFTHIGWIAAVKRAIGEPIDPVNFVTESERISALLKAPGNFEKGDAQILTEIYFPKLAEIIGGHIWEKHQGEGQ